MIPYRPRPIRFHGVEPHRGWRLKLYSIVYGGEAFSPSSFAPGVELALASLPPPAEAEGRPGVGFLILHRGRSDDYVVLAWWDRINELPVRVLIREAGASWRPARGGESFCVWDLQVLWFEREAYVATVLAPGHPDPTGDYLSRHLDVGPEPDPDPVGETA